MTLERCFNMSIFYMFFKKRLFFEFCLTTTMGTRNDFFTFCFQMLHMKMVNQCSFAAKLTVALTANVLAWSRWCSFEWVPSTPGLDGHGMWELVGTATIHFETN
jgi:hypothetical protein